MATRASADIVSDWYVAFHDALTAGLGHFAMAAEGRNDALQDLWLAVLLEEPPQAIREDATRLLGWLIRIARRRLIDYLRREKRRRQVPLGALVARDNGSCEEARQHVHAVLASMAAEGNSAAAYLLEQRFIEGRSVADIARETGLSPQVISLRIQRAKRKFRAAWNGGGVAIEQDGIFVTFFAIHLERLCDSLVAANANRRFAMIRKAVRFVVLFCGLVCMMGADTIDWDAGQPVANPGGQALSLEAKGTYSVDPGHNGGTVSLWTKQKGVPTGSASTANMNKGKWDKTHTTLAANQYETWGELVSWDPATKTFVFTKTSVATVTIK